MKRRIRVVSRASSRPLGGGMALVFVVAGRDPPKSPFPRGTPRAGRPLDTRNKGIVQSGVRGRVGICSTGERPFLGSPGGYACGAFPAQGQEQRQRRLAAAAPRRGGNPAQRCPDGIAGRGPKTRAKARARARARTRARTRARARARSKASARAKTKAKTACGGSPPPRGHPDPALP